MSQGDRHARYAKLVAAAQELPRLRVAVAHPCDTAALGGAIAASELGLIEPILVGRSRRSGQLLPNWIMPTCRASAWSMPSTAVTRRPRLSVRAGEAEAVMKGSLHTDELMAAVVSRELGLRTARRISHCVRAEPPRSPDHRGRRGEHRAHARG
jgi:phosphate acetyltransferase